MGIVLTHGHEDHIGAINALWPRLKKPLYATPFTAARIQQAVSEQSWGNQARINVIPQDSSFSLGPFDLQYIRMAHSIPEANAVAVTVKDVGTLVHTGDWKIDPDPFVGNMTDVAALQALGESGVLAVLGDSTNAMVPGHSGSEGEVGRNLAELFSEFEGKPVQLLGRWTRYSQCVPHFFIAANVTPTMRRGRVKQTFGGLAQNDHVDPCSPRIRQSLRRIRIGFDRPNTSIKSESIAKP